MQNAFLKDVERFSETTEENKIYEDLFILSIVSSRNCILIKCIHIIPRSVIFFCRTYNPRSGIYKHYSNLHNTNTKTFINNFNYRFLVIENWVDFLQSHGMQQKSRKHISLVDFTMFRFNGKITILFIHELFLRNFSLLQFLLNFAVCLRNWLKNVVLKWQTTFLCWFNIDFGWFTCWVKILC